MEKAKTPYKNKVLRTVLIFLAVCMAIFLFLQLQARNAVEQFLERKIPSHVKLKYEDLEVSFLSGTVHFSNIGVQLSDRDTTLIHTDMKAENLDINGIGYWQFFINSTIKADRVALKSPQIAHYASKLLSKENNDQNEPQGVVNLLKDIIIGEIAITDGSFDMTKKEDDSLEVQARNINFTLLNGRTNPEIITKKIPLEYEDYEFAADKIFVDLGAYETVTADKLSITRTDALLKNTVLKSKYSKADLSREIRKEHDHLDLRIPEFRLKGIAFGFEKRKFFFFSKFGEILDPVLTIYRDKLVGDDTEPKRMYSTMLREIPVHIAIDSLSLNGGKVRYEENSTYETKAGSLFFDALSMNVYDINNRHPDGEKTVAKINGNLMGEAPISLDYRFDTNRKDDAFTLTGALSGLNGERVNSFLRPNLNAQITGEVNELYFTVSGNNLGANGDMKMRYSDLEFEILKKDRLGVNKVLSAIGNLFVNDGSDADANGYRYGNITVERDPTKSFLNFIWIITQDGLLSTLTGNGKKKDK